ncbi:MAG: rhomboid family intramembrane serine protease [Prevotella sp.]|nr:rhomboid family intramembrane serine protease [Prevotella sp.]
MFRNIPIVTKNLLIVNVLAYLATIVLKSMGVHLDELGGLHFFLASDFHLHQFVTYQFLHGSFTHLFFNMFALWMFGCVIENVWGQKKFLFYYIFCGIGAGLCQELVQYAQYATDTQLTSLGLNDLIRVVTTTGTELMTVEDYLNGWLTIGASGAVYAILLAFGMTFPNERIFIFPLPVPIKAKWFVCIYAAIELFSAMSSAGDGVAHIAHLGGMLFGFLLINYWRKHPSSEFDLSGGRQFFDKMRSNFERRNGSGSRQSSTLNLNQRGEGYGSTREDDMAYNARKQQRQAEIDKLLDKIRQSGYDSLTKEEKQRLFEASREK